ncbi:hsp90-like protein [Diplodia corticola]|uniref:Hsp90-like protein n=1 Tax=Diplodia corticola TaxID=236234 RepID=A0A1J9RER9_9PEZI|nr:hsp90-like protein [Diplodia corticola]OJD38897.1 hsp90-like protein [Diplodia corticola]
MDLLRQPSPESRGTISRPCASDDATSIYFMCDDSWADRGAVDEVNQIRLLDFLRLDTRPTFVLDLASLGETHSLLHPIYCNPALLGAANGTLLPLITGRANVDAVGALFTGSYSRFRTWTCSPEDGSRNGGFRYANIQWTKLVLMGRWSVVSGVLDQPRSDLRLADLFHTSPQPTARTLPTFGFPGFSRDMHPNQCVHLEAQSDDLVVAQLPSLTPDSPEMPAKTTDRPLGMDDGQSNDARDTPSIHCFDWTSDHPYPDMSAHVKFARSVDWSQTPLGPMGSWTSPLRTMSNLVMRDPNPSVLFWGEEVTMIYNEAYIELIGELHPIAMGKSAKVVFEEFWSHFVPIISRNRLVGEAVPETNKPIFLARRNMVEETYFSFTFLPVMDDQGNVVGHYEPVKETTTQVVSERRLSTLLRLIEETSIARTPDAFWSSVLQGLSANDKDIPFATLYAIECDGGLSEDSYLGSIKSVVKECTLKGSLGIPEGHPAAPPHLDLLEGIESFMPYLQEAVDTGKPILFGLDEPAFPMDLFDGIRWRGFGDPCNAIVICPITPTTTTNALGFLIVGLNSRRPYDDDYQQFMGVIARSLATSLASVVLHEEEIRSRERVISQAELMKTQLSEQLDVSRKEVARNEKKFQRFAERADVAIFIVGSDGHYTYRNQAWFEIFQLGDADLDVRDAWPRLCYAEDIPRCEEYFKRLMADNCPINFELRLRRSWTPATDDAALMTADGNSVQSVWILCSAYPEVSESGEIKEIVGCVTDISRQKWGEWLQKQRTEDALESKRQLENFIDTTSHEMRNPLGAVIQCADGIIASHSAYIDSNSDLGELERKLLDSGIDSAQTIAQCSQHMKRIVDDVLTMSKLDSGLLIMTPVDTQPEYLGRHAVKMFEAEARAAGVDLKYTVDPSCRELGLDWVSLDPTRLLQIIINLVTNAIKFTRLESRRTVILSIGASTQRPSRCKAHGVNYIRTSASPESPSLIADWAKGGCVFVQFAVQDTGRGLTEEEKQLLFARFSQASPRTHIRYGGSGLGLFISRRLTEMQGGAIGFSSHTRGGSTFAFYVKARRSAPPTPLDVGSTESMQEMMDVLTPLTPTGSADDEFVQTPPATKVHSPVRARSDSLDHDLQESSSPAKRPSLRRQQSNVLDPIHVLLVEDNLINQRVLAKELNGRGCLVSVANHGAEALEFLRRTMYASPEYAKVATGNRNGNGNDNYGASGAFSPPAMALDVILMDWEMPVMDGLSAVREIRRMQKEGVLRGHVPVIAVTANVRNEQVTQAMDAGMDDVVSKPFRVPELCKRMRGLMRQLKGPKVQLNGEA